MSKGYFITGTGTDVGKTYVSALLVKYFHKINGSTAYYKAALSGLDIAISDALYVQEISEIKDEAIKVSYTFDTAVSPHLASKIENKRIDFIKIKKDFYDLQSEYQTVIVEGSGGIICPIAETSECIMLEDIINMTQYPLIIVTDSELGGINAAVLTSYYAKTKGMNIYGFIMNNYDSTNILHVDNKKMIEKLSGIPIIGYVANNGNEILGFGENSI